MIARMNGRCTLCGKYVRRGKSRIDTLGFPMPVDPEHASYDPHFQLGQGRWIVWDEVFHIWPPASTWQHQDCVTKFLRQHGHDTDDHRRIADARVDALQEKRHAGEAAQRTGDQWPTRRAKRKAVSS